MLRSDLSLDEGIVVGYHDKLELTDPLHLLEQAPYHNKLDSGSIVQTNQFVC